MDLTEKKTHVPHPEVEHFQNCSVSEPSFIHETVIIIINVENNVAT